MARFAYDASGNVTSITDPGGNVRTFTYEPIFNKVTSITDPLGNVTRFEYDLANGNRLQITDPLGNVTRITYNPFGQPTSTTYALGNITTFEYDAAGNLVRITDPLGNATTRTYDLVSRLVTQTDPRGKATRFAYDPLNRLLSIVDPLGGTTSFTYDPNGNLLSVTDARGNTITHEYDNMDRLSRRIDQLGAAETFAYDGLGRRVERSVNAQRSQFQYDIVNITAELRDGSPVTYLRGLSVDEVFRIADGSGTRYATTDTLGSIINLTDENGSIQADYRYGPFGQTERSGQDGANPVQFTGRENDRTGLYYYRLRYYHPTLARFISPDPLRPLMGADLNLYAYVSNSPLNAVDPFGLYEEDVHRDLTYFLARHAGYSESAARRIAASNQGTDDNPETSPFASVEARRDWHFTTEARRQELWKRALDGNLDNLGQYLHALQDSYSHEGYPAWRGHFPFTAPDKTYNDPEKANRMARDTYNRLRQYLQATTGQPVPDQWDEIRERVDRFNRARTAHEKSKILGT